MPVVSTAMLLPRASLRVSVQRPSRVCRVVVLASSDGAKPTQKHVVVIGGTGRVGSSTAAALIALDPNLKVSIAGRSQESHAAMLLRRPELASVPFKQCDITDLASVQVIEAVVYRCSDACCIL